MKILRNRAAIGLICIALATAICFVVTPLLGDAMKARTQIVRVTSDIRKGEEITADKLQSIDVGGYNLPDGVIKDSKAVVGKYAVADIFKGDYILPAKLTSSPAQEDDYLYRLPDGKQAISVSIKNLADGLSGKLKTDDIVSVIASDVGQERATISPPELQYIKVLAVTTGKGTDITQKATNETSQDQALPATVTLLVNSTQAQKLAEIEGSATIHMSLVSRGNDEKEKALLDEQEKLFSGGDARGR